MQRPDPISQERCEELRNALRDLKAAVRPAPASGPPNDINTLAPDPPVQGDPLGGREEEIARLEQALREAGCED